MIHGLIVAEFEKYPSTIVKPADILAKAVKVHVLLLLKMISNKKLPVLNCTCAK